MRLRLALPFVLALGLAEAHDGSHLQALDTDAGPESVRRAADGSLFVPKLLQRQLRLRTAGAADARTITLLAEVQAAAGRATTLAAPEAGRLEAPAGGWPLPGQTVARGAVLAWLVPAVPPKEQARRRAQRADLAQRLAIAKLNADRLRLQAAVTAEGQVAPGNVYLEQTLAEEAGLTQQLAQADAALAGRRALRAPADGVLAEGFASAGAVVAGGAALFRLQDDSVRRLRAVTYEPALTRTAFEARWQGRPLVARGTQPAAGGGWELLFDLDPGARAPTPGALTEIAVSLPAAGRLPAGACERRPDGVARVWLHGAAEQFIPVTLPSCDAPLPAADAARVVVEGNTLLSAYQARFGL